MILWDSHTGHKVRVLTPEARFGDANGGSIGGVAFRPDGARLATANADGTIRIFDPNSGQELKMLTGHNASAHPRVWAVAYNNDGALLASAGADSTVRLWKPVPLAPSTACEIVLPHLPRDVLVKALGNHSPKGCRNLKG